MTARRAARALGEALAIPIGLAASLGIVDALRSLPGPGIALALPLRETGHGDGAPFMAVLGACALVYGLAAFAMPARRPLVAVLLRSAGVLAAALVLQAASLELVRQASLGFDASAALHSSPPFVCALGALLGGGAAAWLASSDRRMPPGLKEHPVEGRSTTAQRVKIGS